MTSKQRAIILAALRLYYNQTQGKARGVTVDDSGTWEEVDDSELIEVEELFRTQKECA